MFGALKERSLRWLTPLARRSSRLTPNTLSLLALACGALGGLAYGLTRWQPGLFFAGAALAIVSGLLDVLDGMVARLSGRTSALGNFLDHLSDRLVEVALLAGLAFAHRALPVLGLGTLVLVLLHAYLGTQIEAAFGERWYGGAGKPELFTVLVALSLLLGAAPDLTFHLGRLEVAPINAFFALMAAGVVPAFLHRLRHALRLAAETERRGASSSQGDQELR